MASGKICYSFCRSVRATMWRMVGRYKGNKNGKIVVRFRVVVGGKDFAGKKCGIITCCEEHDSTVMDGVTMPLKRSFELLKWEFVGEVCIPGVFKEGDIAQTDGCRQAAELAVKF